MLYNIRITLAAQQDVLAIQQWWAAHHSTSQSHEWYAKILSAIDTLKHMPKRCAAIREHSMFEEEVRQLFFGIGNRYTHRVVFSVEGSTVVILRVYHVSQQLVVN